MNRRGFFSRLGLVTAGFAILPSATTYERIWKPVTGVLTPLNPEMTFSERDFYGKWKFLTVFIPRTSLFEFATALQPPTNQHDPYPLIHL
jgi:hypothetical protein